LLLTRAIITNADHAVPPAARALQLRADTTISPHCGQPAAALAGDVGDGVDA
jgi:hypothetical protein